MRTLKYLKNSFETLHRIIHNFVTCNNCTLLIIYFIILMIHLEKTC